MEENKHKGCGIEFPHFGASYPDAQCIDGYLWDLDSYDNGFLTIGGYDACPVCNTEKWLEQIEIGEDGDFETKEDALAYVKKLKQEYGDNH